MHYVTGRVQNSSGPETQSRTALLFSGLLEKNRAANSLTAHWVPPCKEVVNLFTHEFSRTRPRQCENFICRIAGTSFAPYHFGRRAVEDLMRPMKIGHSGIPA